MKFLKIQQLLIVQVKNRSQRAEPSTTYCLRCGDNRQLVNVCRRIRSICGTCGEKGYIQIALGVKFTTNHKFHKEEQPQSDMNALK